MTGLWNIPNEAGTGNGDAARTAKGGLSDDVKILRGDHLTAKRCRNTAWGFNPRKVGIGRCLALIRAQDSCG